MTTLDFDGRVAVVTGAGRELVAPMGAFLAHESCPAGAGIYLTGAGPFARLYVASTDGYLHHSLTLSDSEHHPAGGRERSSAAWSGGQPRRPVAVFRHRAVAAAKPSGDPPSLARVRRGGAQGVALTPGSVRSRRCHTCPSAHLRVFNVQHQGSTRTQYRVRKLAIQ